MRGPQDDREASARGRGQAGDPADAELALKATGGALVARFLDWLDGRLISSRDQLIDYCTRLTLTTMGIHEAGYHQR